MVRCSLQPEILAPVHFLEIERSNKIFDRAIQRQVWKTLPFSDIFGATHPSLVSLLSVHPLFGSLLDLQGSISPREGQLMVFFE